MERIPAHMKFRDLRSNGMRQSFHMMNLAWKDLEEHLDSSEKTIDETVLELQVREDDLNSRRKSIADSKEEFELMRKEMESRLEELGRREAEFDRFQRERTEYLRTREERLEARFSDVARLVEERIDATVSKEERMEWKVNQMLNELEFSEALMRNRSRKSEFDEKHERCWKELLMREKLAETMAVKHRERSEDLNLRERILRDRSKSLDVMQKLNEESRMAMELKGKQFKEIELQNKELKFELAQKSKETEKTRELLEQEKIKRSIQSCRASWYSFPLGTVPDLFQLSSDPARLLLDSMQCCFLSILKDDTKDANNTMVVFLPLLKEWVKSTVKIEIQNNIQSEALSFAGDWKGKLQFPKGEEAFCYILFLSIYKLGSWFNHEELLHLLCECNNDLSGYLLRDFGLEQKMVECIQKLVEEEQQQQLKAVGYIYDFGLVSKFSPVSLLKDYLSSATIAARELYNRDDNAESKAKAVEEELTVVQEVMKCIVDRGVESLYPIKPLRKRANELLKKMGCRKCHDKCTPPPYNLRSRAEKPCQLQNQDRGIKRPVSLPMSELEDVRVKRHCCDRSSS